MGIRRHLSLCFALLACLVLASPIRAQDLQPALDTIADAGQVYLSGEVLTPDSLIDLSTTHWRFHEGDDPAWADPSFDDSAWDLIDTDFQPDSLYEAWQGIGWFRLHLHIDSLLHDTLLGVYTYHAGASEIYLDGEKIGGFGVIGTTAAADQTYIPIGLPLTVHLDDSSQHVLAVRYANRALSPRQLALHTLSLYEPAGFALAVGANTDMVHRYIFEKSMVYTDALLMGVLLLIAVLHLLLYGLDRRDRTNLFFGLAAMCMSVGHFGVGHAFGYRFLLVDGALNEVLLYDIGFHAFIFFLLLLLATIYSLYAPRLVRYLWVVAVAWVMLWLGMGNAIYRLIDIGLILALVLIAEAIRMIVYAIYKRQEGSWILGVAVPITGLAFMVLAMREIDPGSREMLTDTPYLVTWLGVWVMLLFIPTPLGMSVLLARRYTWRSQRLERELERVEELSEQTLTQEREKQALIASQNERLEAEVAERTSELKQSLDILKATQGQLIQAEKMASLGSLTAGIAHEIKNPLNFVNNFAEVNEELAQELREALANGEDVEDLLADLEQNAQVIAKHGKRADGIVKSMMEHARGGEGERQATEVNAFVEEYFNLAYHGMCANVPDFNATLKRDYDESVGMAEMVPQEMGRVLINLLNNAFYAVHEKAQSINGDYEPTVTITTKLLEEQVAIRVTDNGSGISEEIRDKIFEPFYTTKPTGQGNTGLGLSLSYDIVTQGHGGTLTVESAQNEGASFTIILPAV